VEERLRLFCDQVEKTRNRRAVSGPTIRASFNLSMSQDETTFSHDTGDEDDVRSLMMDMRMYLSPKEDVHFPSVTKLLDRRLTDEELRRINRQNREAWRRAMRGQMGVTVNGKRYTAHDFFKLVVNGELAHLDPEKAAEFADLDPIIQGLGRHAVNGMVIHCLRILVPERNLVRKALEEGLVRLDDDWKGRAAG